MWPLIQANSAPDTEDRIRVSNGEWRGSSVRHVREGERGRGSYLEVVKNDILIAKVNF